MSDKRPLEEIIEEAHNLALRYPRDVHYKIPYELAKELSQRNDLQPPPAFYTFKEIAKRARTWENTQKPGSVNVLGFIADLAEACAVLEYNTAQQLAHKGQHVRDNSTLNRLVDENIKLLRMGLGQ